MRSYDACYYEIGTVDQKELDKIKNKDGGKATDLRLKVKILKSTEMNVYLYGGKDRFTATNSIIKENA